MNDIIFNICNSIFSQLGPGHSEVVYQTALILELYNLGAKSVESEKHVPVFFIDSNNTQHTIGNERIDILARINEQIILIELKAVLNINRSSTEQQLMKYERSLTFMNIIPTHKLVINFPQNPDKKQVELLSFN
jgi:GxxExxY protein